MNVSCQKLDGLQLTAGASGDGVVGSGLNLLNLGHLIDQKSSCKSGVWLRLEFSEL